MTDTVTVFRQCLKTVLFCRSYQNIYVLSALLIIIIQHLYSAMGSYWDTEALVAPVKTV